MTDSHPPRLVVAVHGILTGTSEPTWPQQFHGWLASRAVDPAITVLTDHYMAYPLPMINWWKNRRRGAALANQIAFLAANLALRGPAPRIDLVGHSNGCCILVEALKRLAKRGVTVDTAVFIAAAIDASPERNGLAAVVRSGHLRQALAWWSRRDWVLGTPAPLRWPYGNLGKTGWVIDSPRATLADPLAEAFECSAFSATMFPNHGHNGWWKPENREESFDLLAREFDIPLLGTARGPLPDIQPGLSA